MTAEKDVYKYQSAISIHMPHTWHDMGADGAAAAIQHFNPHATYVA